MQKKAPFNGFDRISKIPLIPKMLDVICEVTNMKFAAVAKVTQDQWIACSVVDHVGFGLLPGDELDVKKTICNEIRESHQIVASDDALNDPDFNDHPVPKLYGISSYISVPILLSKGSFFGTLCAFDYDPRKVNNQKIIALFCIIC